MMEIIVVGLSHKSAPVEIRERMCFPDGGVERPLRRILSLPSIREDLILSTCNRFEVYVIAGDIDDGTRDIKDFFSSLHGIPRKELEQFIYAHEGQDAVRHIFRVASSLDSMVVGEPQILGQIKDAFSEASRHGVAGAILSRLFNRAFRVAKRVRTETSIGERAISISFVAVELARKIFQNLEDKAVLLVGAGEMGELAARHLIAHGVSRVTVTNRRVERARELAAMFGGDVLPFDRLPQALGHADIIISSTASRHHVIDYATVNGVIKARKNRSMFFIDIAVPRDVDPRVNSIENVYLYDIDDLRDIADANVKERQKEADKAEAIVEGEVTKFCRWYSSLETVPTIRLLREKVEAIRRKELNKALSALSGASEKERNVLNAMTSAIVNKILHDPITVLKRSDQDSSGTILADAVKELFRLDDVGPVEKNDGQKTQNRDTGE